MPLVCCKISAEAVEVCLQMRNWCWTVRLETVSRSGPVKALLHTVCVLCFCFCFLFYSIVNAHNVCSQGNISLPICMHYIPATVLYFQMHPLCPFITPLNTSWLQGSWQHLIYYSPWARASYLNTTRCLMLKIKRQKKNRTLLHVMLQRYPFLNSLLFLLALL